MHTCGGFEGNGQTLRILTQLEKYQNPGKGLNPTRRLVLGVLKYPVPYGDFRSGSYQSKRPKCYFNEEEDTIAWAMKGFSEGERTRLKESRDAKDRTVHLTFDCSILNLADDIAYGGHDIEDITARALASHEAIKNDIEKAFEEIAAPLRTAIQS